MQRFTRSPMRGWRWLYSFFGLLMAGLAAYVFLTWPYDVSIDLVIACVPNSATRSRHGPVVRWIRLKRRTLGRVLSFCSTLGLLILCASARPC